VDPTREGEAVAEDSAVQAGVTGTDVMPTAVTQVGADGVTPEPQELQSVRRERH